MNGTNVQTTAGLGGFVVLFLLALVIFFLGRDMTRRIRRLSLEEEDEWLGEDGTVVKKTDAAAPAGGKDEPRA